MTIEDFWNYVEEARKRSASTAEVPEQLVSMLSHLPAEEIVSFRFHLEDCDYRADDACLWLAVSVLCGGSSDDSFVYFRRWLVAQGKHVFEAALRDPDSIAEVNDLQGKGFVQLEALGAVDFHAYQAQTGLDDNEAMDRYNQLCERLAPPRLSRVTATRNSEFLSFSEEEGVELFPKLAARHKVEWARMLSRYGNA